MGMASPPSIVCVTADRRPSRPGRTRVFGIVPMHAAAVAAPRGGLASPRATTFYVLLIYSNSTVVKEHL